MEENVRTLIERNSFRFFSVLSGSFRFFQALTGTESRPIESRRGQYLAVNNVKIEVQGESGRLLVALGETSSD